MFDGGMNFADKPCFRQFRMEILQTEIGEQVAATSR
jgi:hypothetical protein